MRPLVRRRSRSAEILFTAVPKQGHHPSVPRQRHPAKRSAKSTTQSSAPKPVTPLCGAALNLRGAMMRNGACAARIAADLSSGSQLRCDVSPAVGAPKSSPRMTTHASASASSTGSSSPSPRFAMRLKEFREDAGMTQAALAAKIGVSRAYLARLEMGRHDLPLSMWAIQRHRAPWPCGLPRLPRGRDPAPRDSTWSDGHVVDVCWVRERRDLLDAPRCDRGDIPLRPHAML